MVGAEPVAAGLLGVAGAAKGVEAVASGVSSGAKAVGRMGTAVDTAASVGDHAGHAIDKIRSGNIGGAIKEVKETEKSARSLKKQIERKK